MLKIAGLLVLLVLLLGIAGCNMARLQAETAGKVSTPDTLGPVAPNPGHIDGEARRVLFQFAVGTGRKVYEFKILARRAG